MKRADKRCSASLFSFKRFALIFITEAIVVTFVSLGLFSDMGYTYTDVGENAIKGLGYTLLLSGIITLIDYLRRKLTIETPLKKILFAADQVTKGNLNVKIPAKKYRLPYNEFDLLTDNFNVMIEELSGIETLKSGFISDVSHEFRTPLAVIRNYAELMKNPELSPEERQEYAEVLVNSADCLSELITNILKLNKLENQQIVPDFQIFNLSEQLCECLLSFESQIEEKQLTVETDIQNNVFIKSEPDILSIVWKNLISNAVKFNKQGGSLNLSLVHRENKVTVCICDTGCGIDKETEKHIFEKFYQGDSSHSFRGNGLGLALVKRIVDITECEIAVESEVGKGSTFTITIYV